MNRRLSQVWQRLLRRLGVGGLLGMTLLAAGLAMALWLPQLHQRNDQLRAAISTQAEVSARRETPASTRRSGADRASEFVGSLPTLADNANDLDKLFALAKKRALDLPKGEYQLKAEASAALVSFTVTLPLRSEYGPLKEFVADVLDALPHVSMDEMRMSRPDAGGTVLDSLVRFTFVYRK